jgi:hypothetical protein
MLEHWLGFVTAVETPLRAYRQCIHTLALCANQGTTHPHNNRQERFLSMPLGLQRFGLLSRWDWRDGRPRDGASASTWPNNPISEGRALGIPSSWVLRSQ